MRVPGGSFTEGQLAPVRRVEMNGGPFTERIGLPHSRPTKTDRLTCIYHRVFRAGHRGHVRDGPQRNDSLQAAVAAYPRVSHVPFGGDMSPPAEPLATGIFRWRLQITAVICAYALNVTRADGDVQIG